MATMNTMELSERLRHRLARRKRVALRESASVACAVLVPLVITEDGYGVVYTLRSEHLPNHKGQVAFPGGKHSAESDPSLLETALRESQEEIGIRPSDVEILGQLDDVYTMATDYVITPYVGLLSHRINYRPNPGEVEDVFIVSVNALLDRGHHEKETKEWQGMSFDVDVITAGRHRIWGATHRITVNLLECLVDAE